MARNTIHVDAPAHAVFEVLADPRLYGSWVVGASTARDVEGRWPEPGSRLHHTQMGVIRDTTTVLECEPDRRVLLEARARPVMVARVDVRLEPEGDGTHVILDEWAVNGIAAAVPRAISDAAIHVRNAVAVRRLRDLALIGYRLGRAHANPA
jgi:uncharacterized protein YndB with AHSA1/START domain